jgi:hypothetical protein
MPEPEVNPMSERSAADTYQPAWHAHPSHAEGTLTRLVEQKTAAIPSAVFLLAAYGAMLASVTLELTGRSRAGRFVSMWAPTLLIAGVYNKLVKTFGSS